MKVTQKGRYGLLALATIALEGRARPVQMRTVADSAQIPARFLEQILHELKRARLVTAKRGPKGGYQLTRHPATITLGDVLRALEAVPARRARPKLPRDPVDAVLLDLERRVDECFDAFSLADVCRRAELPQRALGDRRLESEGPEYAI